MLNLANESNENCPPDLHYRGYYYDTETGFYYLQSRYYDPITHRFINADSYGVFFYLRLEIAAKDSSAIGY